MSNGFHGFGKLQDTEPEFGFSAIQFLNPVNFRIRSSETLQVILDLKSCMYDIYRYPLTLHLINNFLRKMGVFFRSSIIKIYDKSNVFIKKYINYK